MMQKKEWKNPIIVKMSIPDMTLDGTSGRTENKGADYQPSKKA